MAERVWRNRTIRCPHGIDTSIPCPVCSDEELCNKCGRYFPDEDFIGPGGNILGFCKRCREQAQALNDYKREKRRKGRAA